MGFIFSPSTASQRSLYATMQSSTPISSRPSIIAISLCEHISNRLLENKVLLIASASAANEVEYLAWLYGWQVGSLLSFVVQSIHDVFNMKRFESPRTLPPSRDNRQSPDSLRRFGSPPYLVNMVCSIARLIVRVELVAQSSLSMKDD